MTRISRKRRGDPLTKGQWYFNQDAEVKVSCPDCGGVGDLNGHTITGVGRSALVEPSLVCDCGFHDTIALLDYSLEQP